MPKYRLSNDRHEESQLVDARSKDILVSMGWQVVCEIDDDAGALDGIDVEISAPPAPTRQPRPRTGRRKP